MTEQAKHETTLCTTCGEPAGSTSARAMVCSNGAHAPQAAQATTLPARLRALAAIESAALAPQASALGQAASEAAAEIERLRDLLRRADAVVRWEHTPLGDAFREEVEAALGIGI